MPENRPIKDHKIALRTWVAFACLTGLAGVYTLQAEWLYITNLMKPHLGSLGSFSFNRLIRLLLNDLFMLGIIAAVFNRSAEVKVGILVAFFEMMVIFPAYLVLKFALEGDLEISNPLLSFIHRLIVNPLLMIILFFALFYQRYFVNKG
jgi:exosortase F-associated protein